MLDAPDRTDHWFTSHGTRCAAWFYPAHGEADTPPPVVVMGHGLGGTRQMRLDGYARRFAAAGIAAVVFDYRGFGDSEGTPRQVVDVRQQLADRHAALAFVRSGALPVDASRVAIWGTSFGGGHVMQVAAEDEQLSAVVAQCPFSDGLVSVWRRTLANPISAFVLGAAAIVDALVGRALGRPILMPMAGSAWMPAFLASPDSLAGAAQQLPTGTALGASSSRWLRRFPLLRRRIGGHVELSDRVAPGGAESMWGTALLPNGAVVVNAIAARLVLTLALYRPGRALRRTGSTPILICVAGRDAVAPPGPTVKAADGLPNVEVRHFDTGHFELYLGDAFEQASADQAAFLRRTLAARAVRPAAA
ncbi:MAG: alpha/beta fold hydrolase [Patulibacter minatonensis]